MHCDSCGTCISGFDHHCPWTGKCIGSGNQEKFYQFIFFALGGFAYCLVVAAMLPLLKPEDPMTAVHRNYSKQHGLLLPSANNPAAYYPPPPGQLDAELAVAAAADAAKAQAPPS